MTVQSFGDRSQTERVFRRREILKLLVVGLFFVVAGTFILEVRFELDSVSSLSVGDIAPQDIVAPDYISYPSDTATAQEQIRAENRVPLYYSRPDPAVARNQLAIADQVLAYLDAVRADADPNLSASEKIDWIKALEPVSLSDQEAAAILNLSDAQWNDAKEEIRSGLDDVMRNEIRESQLISSRRRLNLLISSDVPDEEAEVIIAIAEDLVQPNTFVDEERTSEERQLARDAVEPVYKTYEQNEVVVRAGERLTEDAMEALRAMGFQEPARRWRTVAATLVWLLLLIFLLGYYLLKFHIPLLKSNQSLVVLTIMMMVAVLGIRVTATSDGPLMYALPIAALSVMVAALFDSRLAIIITLMMALIEGYVTGGSLEMVAYVLFSGFVVALAIGPMAQLTAILWTGLYAALTNVVIILAFWLFANNTDVMTLVSRFGVGVLSGALSAGLPLLGFFIVGSTTSFVTYVQLLELSRPTHPLLMELLRRAPGTYHHSLLVSNLAEQAATRIGANSFLCRIGAYYHDVGKMMRPYFFTENMPPGGANLHDDLDPETSAQIIINHVTDGLKLARRYRLPTVFRSFIAEHHGTEVVGYFYHKAIQAADGDESKVNRARFTYPGPVPQSKETAILLLADASEATVRAVQPQSSEEIDQIVRRTISNRMKSGQFDHCGLTMQDFERIRLAFIDVLQGVSHPRIKYPGQSDNEKDKVDTGVLPPLPLGVQGTHTADVTQSDAPIQRD